MILQTRHQGMHGGVTAVHTDGATDSNKDPRFLLLLPERLVCFAHSVSGVGPTWQFVANGDGVTQTIIQNLHFAYDP